MKKSVIGFALMATVVLGATLSSQTVDAARSETSDLTIGFEKGGIGTGPFTKNLNIAQYPSEFNFGKKNKVGETGAVTVDLKSTDKEYLAVFEDRDANKGWNLRGQVSKMVDVNEASKTLDGTLRLKFDEFRKYNMPWDDAISDFVVVDPEAVDPSSTTNEKYATEFNAADKALHSLVESVDLKIGADAATSIMVGADTAKGGAIASLDSGQLIITGGAEKEHNYAGTVTWTLATSYNGDYTK